MEYKLIGLLVASLVNFALGVFVLLKNRKLLVNKLFVYYSSGVGFWVFSVFMIESKYSLESVMLWEKLAFAAASFLPVSCLSFVTTFPMMRKLKVGLDLRIFTWLAIVFYFISFTPFMVGSASINSWGVQTNTGPLFPLFGIYFLTGYIWALFKLYLKGRQARGIEKLQCQYLLLGLTFSAIFCIGTNLLIPMIFGSSRYAGFGPSSTIVMIGFIAHTIVRYRLLHIHVVLKKGFIYTLSIVMAAAGFILLLASGDRIMRDVFGFSYTVTTVIIAVVVAIAFYPLRQQIQRFFDRYFYREHYDYNATLMETSRSLTSMLSLEHLVQRIYEVIDSTMHPERVCLYIKGQHQTAFELILLRDMVGTGEENIPRQMSAEGRMISYLALRQDLVLREELIRLSAERGIEEVFGEMAAFDIDVAVPVILEGHLIAVIMLGAKCSGDIYSPEDMGLLVTMSNQAAVAINNAQLYEEVRRVKDYNESILADMESGVITVDVTGRVVLSNRAAARIFGREEKDMVGTHINDISSMLFDMAFDALDNGRTFSSLEVNLADGEEGLPLVLSTTLLRNLKGETEGAILVFSDLSRIKALEEERNQSERLAYVGSLAAGLAHEIKNPLVSIKTFMQLLPERYDDAEFREVFSQLVVKEIERIDLLISQLLGFSRSSPAELLPVDIKDPLDEMLLLLSNRLQEHLIEVRKSYPPEQILILADGSKIKQIFLNMFLNAIEAMPDGGELSVEVARGVNASKDVIRISISNTGKPIPESLRRKVFSPFYSTKPGGTGLGLSICQKIVSEHGGQITLAETDRTTFIIDLPAFKVPPVRMGV